MTPQRLPDTGGYYFDRESGISGIVNRNIDAAKRFVTDGSFVRQILAFGIGAFAWHTIKKYYGFNTR